MSDLETGLREAIEGVRSAPHKGNGKAEPPFSRIRANTRGMIIAAHRELTVHWTEADDQMLDMVTAWLDNVRARA